MNVQDYTGKQFGRLTIQALDKSNKVWYANCICTCGKLKRTQLKSLKFNRTKSCGCLHKEQAAERCRKGKLPKGESPQNILLACYRKAAQKRQLSFSLTKEEFRELISQSCAYCGDAPKNRRYSRYSHHDDSIDYNGIDRVDNNLGYDKSNCVPCCEICNKSKQTLTLDEFKNHIIKVVCHLRLSPVSNESLS
jgi:hypothetical protein